MPWTATSSDRSEHPSSAAPPPRLVLVGPPGSGKSSQGSRLASRLRITHVSTGELLRDEVRRGTPLGRQAQDDMDAGRLAPDWLIFNLVESHFYSSLEGGFVLDGYPRTLEQAQRFMRSPDALQLDRVIELATPDEVAVRRLTARAVCGHCGQMSTDTPSVCCRPVRRRHGTARRR